MIPDCLQNQPLGENHPRLRPTTSEPQKHACICGPSGGFGGSFLDIVLVDTQGVNSQLERLRGPAELLESGEEICRDGHGNTIN